MLKPIITRIKPRQWEGLPGVSYPEPEPQPAAPRPAPTLPAGFCRKDYLSTQEVAHLWGKTKAEVRRYLLKRNVPNLYTIKGYLWTKRAVNAVTAQRPTPQAALPAGWLTEAETREALGGSRASLYRLLSKSRVRRGKICLKGRYRVIYNEQDVQAISSLLRAKKEIEKQLATWY